MNLPRRQVLRLAAGAAALPVMSRFAIAQGYPSRPVRLVVGYAAGGGVDIVARLASQWLSERLNQQFVIENRGGAASNIATEAVAKSAADGHTLLLSTTANASNASLYEKLNFSFTADFAHVAGIVRVPPAMVISSSFPARTVSEFIVYAKTNPSRINFASGGIGGISHLAGELFNMRAGLKMMHVPYRGNAPALTDLLGGQVQVMFVPILAVIEHIKAGRLRALAVTGPTRSQTLADVPALAELFPDFEATQWYGVSAPRNTPVETVEKLNTEINAALNDHKIQARLDDLGGTPLAGSRADFARLVADETEKWGKVIRAANIKPE